MKLKIMVVDDNDDVRYSIKVSLQLLDPDYEFSEAASGEECLKKIGDVKPELILMDIMMPGISGMDAAIKIKEDSKTKDIRIIYVTAKRDPETKSKGAEVGDGFVEKPFDIKDLDAKIKEVMSTKNSSKESKK